MVKRKQKSTFLVDCDWSWWTPSSLPTLSLLDTASLSFEATPRWPVFRVMETLSQECDGRLSKSYSSTKNLKMPKKCLHEYWDFFHCSHVQLVSPNLISWKRLCCNELRTDKTPFIMTTHEKSHSLELPELNFGLRRCLVKCGGPLCRYDGIVKFNLLYVLFSCTLRSRYLWRQSEGRTCQLTSQRFYIWTYPTRVVSTHTWKSYSGPLFHW